MSKEHQKGNKNIEFKLGIGAIFSCLGLYTAEGIITLLPKGFSLKGMVIGGIIIISEMFFVIAVILLGKQVVKKYKSKLNPKKLVKDQRQ